MSKGGKHRAPRRRGTIRGRPVDDVEDVALTGDELAERHSEPCAMRHCIRCHGPEADPYSVKQPEEGD